jgi:hypothetical protein
LKIPKGQSESVNLRIDNTMAKRKRTKGQTTLCDFKKEGVLTGKIYLICKAISSISINIVLTLIFVDLLQTDGKEL